MSEENSVPRKPSPSEVKPGQRRDSSYNDVRTNVVEILSNTANGCLNELGYEPGVMQQLKAAQETIKDLRYQNEYLRLLGQQYDMNCKTLQERADYMYEDNVTLNALVRTTQQEVTFIRTQLLAPSMDVKRVHEEYTKLTEALRRSIREAGHYKSLLVSHGIPINAGPSTTPVNPNAPRRNSKPPQAPSHIPAQNLPAPLPPAPRATQTQGLTLNTESVPRIYQNIPNIQTPVNLTPATPVSLTPSRPAFPPPASQIQQQIQYTQIQNRAMQQMYPPQQHRPVIYAYPAQAQPQATNENQGMDSRRSLTHSPSRTSVPGSKRNSVDASFAIDESEEARKRQKVEPSTPAIPPATVAPEAVFKSQPAVQSQPENKDEEDEEEDEPEVDENGLRTISSCIEMAMDYDEDTELLTCRFCDYRKQQGLQETVAIFKDASEEELHKHLEQDHPEAFLELRRSTLPSEPSS